TELRHHHRDAATEGQDLHVTQPSNPHETTPIHTQTPVPPTITVPTTPTTDKPKTGSGGKIARRALLAGVGIGACVAGAELAPVALKKAGEFTQAEVQDAFSAGVDNGRKALLDELSQIEGLTIDGAITAAELTRLAVKFIVLPLSRLISTIEGGALDVLHSALQSAKDNLARINVHISQLDGLEDMVAQWRDNVNQLPTTLDKYANADIDSAESYLRALQKKIEKEKAPSL
ncbi:MAG TPA: hypothetical protein VFU63_05245, partial [Ktedonobacterales bacterium]|nr:hypothetical protein [Ktedonobacterales bacterium]